MFRDLFLNHNGRPIQKWDHYFEIYDKHFSKYIGKPVNILEIGIADGGSLQLWKKYFGAHADIYGMDIAAECKNFEEDQIKIFIGSQSDKDFLRDLIRQLPDLDIILDDGGHQMIQQKTSFEVLFLKLKEGGVYMIEDTHSSYWDQFRGGVKKPSTFIEYSKNLVDSLYEQYIADKNTITINEITKHIECISFYDSIIVFDKRKRSPSFSMLKTTDKLAHNTFIPKPRKKKRTLATKVKSKVKALTKVFSSNVNEIKKNT